MKAACKAVVAAALSGSAFGAVLKGKAHSEMQTETHGEQVDHLLDEDFHHYLGNASDAHTQVLVGHLQEAFKHNNTQKFRISQRFRSTMEQAISMFAPSWFTSSNHGSATSSASSCSSTKSGTSSESFGLGLCVYSQVPEKMLWAPLKAKEDGTTPFYGTTAMDKTDAATYSATQKCDMSDTGATKVVTVKRFSGSSATANEAKIATTTATGSATADCGPYNKKLTFATKCSVVGPTDEQVQIDPVKNCAAQVNAANLYATWRSMFGLSCGECGYDGAKITDSHPFIAAEGTRNGAWFPLTTFNIDVKNKAKPTRGNNMGTAVPILKCGQSTCDGRKQPAFGLPAIGVAANIGKRGTAFGQQGFTYKNGQDPTLATGTTTTDANPIPAIAAPDGVWMVRCCN